MNPTAEQQYVDDMAATGVNLNVQAGAGAGKTTTLGLIPRRRPELKFEVIAFNSVIINDAAGRFPPNTSAHTAHGLAHTGIVKGTNYFNRLKGGGKRMSPFDLAKALGARDVQIAGKRLSSGFIASLAKRTVTTFCSTDKTEIEPWMVPHQDGMDGPGVFRGPAMKELAAQVAPIARRYWADVADPNGTLPFDHGHYLKLFELSGPKIWADVILYDEAQDLNPCMISIVKQQEHAQLVVVGDSQQAIYGWNGAVDALERFGIENTAWLTQSFRFGPAVADVANSVLGRLDTPLRIVGFEGRESVVTPVRAGQRTLLARTNAYAMREAMASIRSGVPTAIVGGGKEVLAFAKAADAIKRGRSTHHHDLACFSTWGEVQDYVEHDPLGTELKLMVDLVDSFGTAALIKALEAASKEEDAELICSTAHKAKGREWDRVVIGADFPDPEKREVSPEELRLLYVAVTRAKLELDITDVHLLKENA